MKKYILICLFLVSNTNVFCQDYMDTIAIKTCDCLTRISDSLEMERFYLEFGLCILNAAQPYNKLIKKDYKIDLNKMDVDGEELGHIVGLRMGSVCPNELLSLSKKVDDNKDARSTSENSFKGEVTAIDENKFVEFSVRNDLGKTSKFHWLSFVSADFELPDTYKTLIGKSVRIDYLSQEFFDPRIGEYRSFNIIKNLEISPK